MDSDITTSSLTENAPRVTKWAEFHRYPVIVGVGLIAIGVTTAWWCKVDFSGLFPTPEIRRGQLWRLFTATFIHLNILHLTFDLYWLWILGTPVERIYGHARTLALLAFLALGSSSLDFAFDHGGVGLSGVGYGLFGFLCILSDRDERFRGILDRRTIKLFVGWFLTCIVTTLTHTFAVANVAHGAGAIVGALLGYATTQPARRILVASAIGAILLFGLWGDTFGRPAINLSGKEGYYEGKWGYDALMAGRNQEAVRWLRDASKQQPGEFAYWFDLGIAYHRLHDEQAASAAYKHAHDLDESKYSQALADEQKSNK